MLKGLSSGYLILPFRPRCCYSLQQGLNSGTASRVNPHPRVVVVSCRALDPEIQAELTKDGRQVAWRFLRRLFKIFDRAGEGLGVTVFDTERLFQVCATSDQDMLQV